MGKLVIKLLVTDCDGVLTDGKIPRRFSIFDGRLPGNYPLVIFTSAVDIIDTAERAKSLGIELIRTAETPGISKLKSLNYLCEKLSIKYKNVAYIGDDTDDIPCLLKAGLSFAPKDAQKPAKFAANKILKTKGGDGVLREAIRIIDKRSR